LRYRTPAVALLPPRETTMATASKTTYTHTCDVCGTEHESKDLRRFGLTPVDANPYRMDLKIRNNKTCDVCRDCQSKPVADILAILEPPPTEAEKELAGLRQQLGNGRR
jgi:hypothetical protein